MSNFYNDNIKKYNLHEDWNDTSKEAYLYEKLDGGKVKCNLCPRRCVLSEDKTGFCKVRKNIDGTLYAQSYEKATHMAIEKITTEAVYNFMPEADILSLGNFGCNLDCDYCQNWMYSRFEYTAPEHIHHYTSQQVIDMALESNTKILSWTYNDPAVWFEYVIDTAKEAKKHGLLNLFKSAFFLTEEAVKELCKVIDVFAVSIKAIDEEYYKKFTKGWLGPVLENTKYVFEQGIPLEVSNLVVTDLTNNTEDYDKMIDFVLKELSPSVPLHFTRFHPDYKFTDGIKTPVEDVEFARNRAMERGLKYSYVGNVFESEGLNTYCPDCKELLISRYGLISHLEASLDDSGNCKKCGCKTGIILK